MSTTPTFRKIVVAIHGVGEQSHAETIRSVATQFGSRLKPPLPLMPLGYFSVDGAAKVKVSGLDLPEWKPDDPHAAVLQQLSEIGFAEVYWADIPRGIIRAGDTIEETKAWAKTIVSRSEAVYRKRHQDQQLLPHDFDRAGGVIEEMIESVEVIENLCTVAEKMGLFKFDVAPLLRDYVNDVQVVTEFPRLREKIVGRFHKAMAGIVQEFGDSVPEIYIVAHSEGTVVSFLALLQALVGTPVPDLEPDRPDGPPTSLPTDWIRRVRGYMTIGSPIDKHLVLWDRLWDAFRLRPDQGSVFDHLPPQRIDWRNYYDHGDPVGFQLDTARKFLAECRCQAFDFPARHDMGFTRYPLPGKAHVDYWQDDKVFGHFIDKVVLRDPAATIPTPAAGPDPDRPPDKVSARICSYALPYVIVVLLHLAAMYLLFKGVNTYMQEDLDIGEIALPVALLALLLLTVTVSARVLRLLKLRWDRRGHVLALLGLVLAYGVASGLLVRYVTDLPSAAIVVASAITIIVSTRLVRSRRRMGRKMLIGTGMFFVLLFAFLHVVGDAQHGPVWPLVLAIAAFCYLWWLAIILFDLAFIWHRYIRHSVVQDKLYEWGAHAIVDPERGRMA